MNNKIIKNLIGITTFAILIYYIYQNLEFINLLKRLNIRDLLFLFLLIILRTIINGNQTKYLYNFSNINLKNLESINLFVKSNLANSISFLNIGGGYKAYFLKKNHNLNIKNYIYLNTLLSGYKIFIFIYLFLLILEFNNELNHRSLFLIGFIPFFIYLFLTRMYPQKFKFLTKIIKNKKNLTLKLNINLFIQFFLNTYILFKYFQIFEFSNSYEDIVLYFLVGFLSSLVKLTPGNIGFKETILIFSKGLHSVSEIQILTISLFSRFFELVILLVVSTLLTYLKKD